ncbi:MAG: zf-HC2 domain-containing protein [Phycisphaeraceae bacterium]|nr:zf-HC2 domain-containing protein [Phycisphaeraceae bacterium]
MEHLNCKQFVEFLDDYVAGAQPDEVRRAFESHIGCCKTCLEFLEAYKATIETSRKACCCGHKEIPRDKVPQGLINAILKARKAGEDS